MTEENQRQELEEERQEHENKKRELEERETYLKQREDRIAEKELQLDVYENSIFEREQIVNVMEEQLSEKACSLEIREAKLDDELPATGRTVIRNHEIIIQKHLECPVCFKLFNTRVRMCQSGHNICDVCRNQIGLIDCPECRQPFISTPNLALEHISNEYALPCEDCGERMPASQITCHELVCSQRIRSCLVSDTCKWNGIYSEIQLHTESVHPTRYYCGGDEHRLRHRELANVLSVLLVAAYGELFTLSSRYDAVTQTMLATVQCIGSHELAENFTFTFVHCGNSSTVAYDRIRVESDLMDVEGIFKSTNAVRMMSEGRVIIDEGYACLDFKIRIIKQ